jgi:hypothetical protein
MSELVSEVRLIDVRGRDKSALAADNALGNSDGSLLARRGDGSERRASFWGKEG